MNKLTFLFCLLISSSLLAIKPTTNPGELAKKFEDCSEQINTELNDLHNVNNLIIENDMNYTELSAAHADMVSSTNLSAASEGILDGHPDSPAGIAGFWWGLVLGWVGMLIVYLTMDEGSGRKEQVMNALWGCVIGTLLWTGLWVLVIASSV